MPTSQRESVEVTSLGFASRGPPEITADLGARRDQETQIGWGRATSVGATVPKLARRLGVRNRGDVGSCVDLSTVRGT